MPSYIYQPELPHGLPTTSHDGGELSHGLPAMDTDTVVEEGIIDPMLIDDDPGQELRYELVEPHVNGQACFILVANVIVGEPNVHCAWGVASDSIRRCLDLWGLEEFDVEIEDWGAEEHLAGDVQEGVSEPWNQPLDDLLLDWCEIGGNSATSRVAAADTADYDIFALHSTTSR
ncbi:hypothetical protein ALT_9416 [Aspergillus lentulus]|uniref:Uncharacterized protein n=1 Tax=Aspergillus lentulus TaxID=293939 RepID=A0AAN4TFK0_ASPLE|nr:hypothetical protein ALT_9416 [Aspergillus lentulus]